MTRPLPVAPSELEHVALFSGLTDIQRRILCGLMQRQSFTTNNVLLTAGEPGGRVYVLQSGTVKVCIARSVDKAERVDKAEGAEESEGHETGHEDAAGETPWDAEDRRTIVLNLCGPGAVLGEISAMDQAGCSAGVVALESCKTLWMDAETFRDCADEMLTLARALVRLTQQRFRMATRQLYAHSSYDVEGRLACQLLLFAERYGEETPDGLFIPLRLYQHDLADMVASSRTRINTAFSTLRAQGCVAPAPQNRLLILDAKKLAAFCP